MVTESVHWLVSEVPVRFGSGAGAGRRIIRVRESWRRDDVIGKILTRIRRYVS